MLTPESQVKLASALVKKGFIDAATPGAEELAYDRIYMLMSKFTAALHERKRYRGLNNDLLKACELALSDPEPDVRLCTILIPVFFSDSFNVEGFDELRKMFAKRIPVWERKGYRELLRVLKTIVLPHIEEKTKELIGRPNNVQT